MPFFQMNSCDNELRINTCQSSHQLWSKCSESGAGLIDGVENNLYLYVFKKDLLTLRIKLLQVTLYFIYVVYFNFEFQNSDFFP